METLYGTAYRGSRRLGQDEEGQSLVEEGLRGRDPHLLMGEDREAFGETGVESRTGHVDEGVEVLEAPFLDEIDHQKEVLGLPALGDEEKTVLRLENGAVTSDELSGDAGVHVQTEGVLQGVLPMRAAW